MVADTASGKVHRAPTVAVDGQVALVMRVEREGDSVWDKVKQEYFDELQQKEQRGVLNAKDKLALDQLRWDLEQDEWQALRPALSRLREEQGELEAEVGQLQIQNSVLAGLAERYADLVARARVQLANLLSERDALRNEVERTLR